ncbi:acidic mammalian chitinase [Drosophila santomea]|uniref:acidic mammalian chitinase n=1 Tax=Drosophila santomea TaxID=129105 RepID=UPI001953B9AD|nr:acidic mammalian chitinase [Drosophila santomea]
MNQTAFLAMGKLLALLAVLCLSQVIGAERIVNCYWGTWANYRSGNGKFDVSNIDSGLCTHLSYSFFGINDNGEIQSLDTWLDYDLGFINKAVSLKNQNSNLKVLAVVGGWNEGSTKYSSMAGDWYKRQNFINSALNLLRNNGFDGLDLDWEYPNQRGGNWNDRANFVTLLREIKEAFAPYGYELGIAVGAGESLATASYEIANIAQHVNFINVMTYDFAMASDGQTGFNAPQWAVENAINFWLSQGAPANKLVLGVGTYGRSFQLSDSSQNWPGAPCRGEGSAGSYTGSTGYLGYNEICQNNWHTIFDYGNAAPYAYSGDQWVSFDNVLSVQYKMDFALSKGLAGAMIWSLETDDYRGLCGQSYPLLRTINEKLRW